MLPDAHAGMRAGLAWSDLQELVKIKVSSTSAACLKQIGKLLTSIVDNPSFTQGNLIFGAYFLWITLWIVWIIYNYSPQNHIVRYRCLLTKD